MFASHLRFLFLAQSYNLPVWPKQSNYFPLLVNTARVLFHYSLPTSSRDEDSEARDIWSRALAELGSASGRERSDTSEGNCGPYSRIIANTSEAPPSFFPRRRSKRWACAASTTTQSLTQPPLQRTNTLVTGLQCRLKRTNPWVLNRAIIYRGNTTYSQIYKIDKTLGSVASRGVYLSKFVIINMNRDTMTEFQTNSQVQKIPVAFILNISRIHAKTASLMNLQQHLGTWNFKGVILKVPPLSHCLNSWYRRAVHWNRKNKGSRKNGITYGLVVSIRATCRRRIMRQNMGHLIRADIIGKPRRQTLRPIAIKDTTEGNISQCNV